MFIFEKLEVWQKAVAFAGLVYQTTKSFPPDERFGLTNQIRRAAVSVSSNIAEGSSRMPADFSKFIGYANGSILRSCHPGDHCPERRFSSPGALRPSLP